MEDPDEDNNGYKSYGVPNAASNCWAVHGNHTETGKPLLACDPHLRKSVQSTWYPLRMSWYDADGDKSYIMGASVVGSPTITYGRTKFMAFGVTALNPDVIDMYTETIKDGKYLYEGEWHALEEYEETIKVRFGFDVTIKVQLTRNGVIVDKDLMDGTAADISPFISREPL